MSALEKVLVAVVGVAMVTTLVLPKRQTPAVLTAGGNAFAKILGAAEGNTT